MHYVLFKCFKEFSSRVISALFWGRGLKIISSIYRYTRLFRLPIYFMLNFGSCIFLGICQGHQIVGLLFIKFFIEFFISIIFTYENFNVCKICWDVLSFVADICNLQQFFSLTYQLAELCPAHWCSEPALDSLCYLLYFVLCFIDFCSSLLKKWPSFCLLWV